MNELKAIALNKERDHIQRKIVVLLIVISCFIAPIDDGHVGTTFVQFVEKLDNINSYAWGAALLAFLHQGIIKWKNGEKKTIDRNFWIILGFFLIRIPKLQTELQIKLNLEDCTMPLLSCVVEEVKKITYNHKPKYIGNVEKILPNLSENDILWTPYESLPIMNGFSKKY